MIAQHSLALLQPSAVSDDIEMENRILGFYSFRATCILSIAVLSLGLASRGEAIEGGGALSDERWGFVLNIRTENMSCSAARVSKKYAITAAHCIGDSPLQVYSGRDAQEYVGTATSVFVDPRYTDREYDVAVIEIDTAGGRDTHNQ